MGKRFGIAILSFFIICLLPFQFAFAASTPPDRNGDGIHIDDIVDFVIRNGISSRSELSDLLNNIISVKQEVLEAPTNVIAAAADSKVNLSWSPVADSTYYNVYQSLDNINYSLITAPEAIASAMYEVSGLTNGVVYYFKITAAKTGVESDYSHAVSVAPQPTAAEVAAGITSVSSPAADETSLTLPIVPFGYDIAIASSSNTAVVGTDGLIDPPAEATNVGLVFTVTRNSDGTSANTVTITVTVPAHVLTAAEVASVITSVAAPEADATSLTLPTVPDGYSLAIASSSNTAVIGTNGAIDPPYEETSVDLVFTVTRTSDGTSAETVTITVTVPAKSNGGPSGYTFCANENEACNFSGLASVAYGANGVFTYNTFLTTVSCSNNVFGDPIGGVVKSCYYQTIAEPTAAEVAAAITSVPAPAADETSLTLPTLPDGYSISIKSSSNTSVVGTDGVIAPPTEATSVDLVFTVTRASNGTSAETVTITVIIPAHVLTAEEVASTITSVAAPAADETSLTLPTVPDGYSIAIASSSNTAVVGTNGVIAPPADEMSVDLVFTVTRTSDGKTANTGTITVTVPAHVLTAEEVASTITSVTAPAADETSLTLPTVPDGYSIAIASSSNTAVVGTNGVIAPPTEATSVDLVFTVTRTSDGKTANTGTITVTVPAHVLTAAEVASTITSVTAPTMNETSLMLPTVPDGYIITIASSSNSVVISTYGVIAPPSEETHVNLVLTVKRTSDGSSANTGSITVTVPANGGPTGYIFCSYEGGTCNISGLASVAYGANGQFRYGTFESTTGCDNGVFGDPIGGVFKSCYYQLVTAAEVAAEITSVAAPAADATSLTLPTVSAGFSISIASSSNTAVINTYGVIAPPSVATNVNLVFKVTRTADNTSANTASITVTVPSHVLTAGEVAAGITSVMSPMAGETSLTLPTVPEGYSIAIYSSSKTVVISTYGVISQPTETVNVDLVFTVTRKSDNSNANTGTITVIVPATSRSGVNVALASNGGTASASSAIGNFPVASINNGDIRGLGWGHGGGWNDDTVGVFPDWVQIDFNESKTINEIDVFTIQDNYGSPSEPTASMTFIQHGIVDFTVQYWDGSTWVTVTNGDVTGNNYVWKQFSFLPIETNKIRVTIIKAADGYSRIIEVEAWSPTTPSS